MDIYYREAELKDLDRIMEIEQAGFTADEAASRSAMEERIALIPDTFVVAVNADGAILGYAVGPVVEQRYLFDELFEKIEANPVSGGFVSLLSVAVAPEFAGAGVASGLLGEVERRARLAGREGITLTCLADLIGFYEKNGYVNEGVSASEHAGEVWYNLVREL
ncbi:GNAT family N-acetyltransferase [Fundicoccus culcitae]|uniref:GNAT family N-acetyltransferase n=1 Tax=Fundicoccus culcitae TaxID=2969821 RepID=A0ABY5P4R8_9LACT|nr:GNAT family N-acetyltransferase [Fundicoccus culcitae]UUX33375.1 GNAT family N-acetyltransferase [Fundicoccus culcitae]